jgi:hypothetical protein
MSANVGPAGAAHAVNAPRAKENSGDDAGFYLAMVALSSLLIFSGFAPSFYLKSVINAPPPLTQLTIVHGVVFTAWMIVVVAQSAFIAIGKPAPHRQLGMAGAILFGAVVSVGLSTAITAARLGHAPPGAPEQPYFMALPMIGIFAVLILVAAALWLRRRSDWHKRLMAAAFFMMTQPGVARLAFPLGVPERGIALSFIVMELLLAVAMVYDFRKYGRVHPAYWSAAVLYAIMHIAVYWAFASPVWLAFANSIITE